MARSARLDLTLVAGRRPELLGRTLASFRDGLFANFSLGEVHANIDPIFGDEADHATCRSEILRHFPQARISEPERPGFGRAVKSLWGRCGGDLIFHLEDDWLLNERVTPERVLPLMTGQTRAIALVSKETGWKGETYNRRRPIRRVLGIPVGRTEINVFGTSPRFLDGGFARACAGLMDPELDPEKQMRPPHNPPLRAYMQDFRCRFLPATAHAELITDIGREWRDARSIEKVVDDGVSTWTRRR